eukprot:gene6139-10147_t
MSQQYCFLEKLGSGTTGNLYKAKNKKGSLCCLKKIPCSSDHEMERNILLKLRSSQVIHVKSGFSNSHYHVLVVYFSNFETKIILNSIYCSPEGNLDDKLKKGLNEQEKIELFYQIVETVGKCHSKNIVHRKLNLKNVLIDQELGKLKSILTGFDDAEELKKKKKYLTSGKLSNSIFQSIEMKLGKKYTFSTDIWSLGIILFEMMKDGHLDFSTKNYQETIKQVPIKKELYFRDKYIEIIKKCLLSDLDERITLPELLQYLSWIKTQIKGMQIMQVNLRKRVEIFKDINFIFCNFSK